MTPNAFGVAVSPTVFRIERLLPGPMERVWAYLVEPEKRRLWFCGGEAEPHVGGRFEMVFANHELSEEAGAPAPGSACADEADGDGGMRSEATITVFEPPRRFGFSWPEPQGPPSEVTIELTEEGEKVRLVLEHMKLQGRCQMLSIAGGWHTHLDILVDRLEGAAPPSFWRRHERIAREYEGRLPE